MQFNGEIRPDLEPVHAIRSHDRALLHPGILRFRFLQGGDVDISILPEGKKVGIGLSGSG